MQLRNKIRSSFTQQMLKDEDPVLSHKKLLRSLSIIWQKLYSNVTCISCLARRPENPLSCRHSFCDPCIVIHRQMYLEEPWRFVLSTCPLCEVANSTPVQIKPYTAGVRCLVMDGADVQDYEILEEVEKGLTINIPLREQFDVVNGSGLGQCDSKTHR